MTLAFQRSRRERFAYSGLHSDNRQRTKDRLMDPRIIKILQDIVGRENVSTDQADRICYSYDATQQKFLPDVVVYPADAQEISLVLKMANAERISVLPRGAGSGFTGGSLPVKGGIVLVTSRLDQILRIDEDNLVAEVEPGVVTEQFQQAVEKVGLFYPPDPASLKFSTLGGNVAECAGGPRCVKYGVTKDYILGLEVVTPQGDIIRTGGQTMKGVVGYDLTKLMVGSEGTLGVITRIVIKLHPPARSQEDDARASSIPSTGRRRRSRPSSGARSSPPPSSSWTPPPWSACARRRA